METYLTSNTEETEKVGAAFAKNLQRGDFVALFGDLGVGKTAFVRGAVKTLSQNARVQSPTYTIVNEYRGAIPLYHFDMYRIDDEDALDSIGYYDYLENGGICFAEWCEKILPYLPETYYRVTIEKVPENVNKRKITVQTAQNTAEKEYLP